MAQTYAAETENDRRFARNRQNGGAARSRPGYSADEQGTSAAGALQSARHRKPPPPRGRRHRQEHDKAKMREIKAQREAALSSHVTGDMLKRGWQSHHLNHQIRFHMS